MFILESIEMKFDTYYIVLEAIKQKYSEEPGMFSDKEWLSKEVVSVLLTYMGYVEQLEVEKDIDLMFEYTENKHIFVKVVPLGEDLYDNKFEGYYSNKSRLGVVTNGLEYHIYTDILKHGVFDKRPIQELNISQLTETDVLNLFRYSVDLVDLDSIKLESILSSKYHITRFLLKELIKDEDFNNLVLIPNNIDYRSYFVTTALNMDELEPEFLSLVKTKMLRGIELTKEQDARFEFLLKQVMTHKRFLDKVTGRIDKKRASTMLDTVDLHGIGEKARQEMQTDKYGVLNIEQGKFDKYK